MTHVIDIDIARKLVRSLCELRQQPAAADGGAHATALLTLFPRVQVRAGYILDYVQDTVDGVRLPSRPFARPVGDDEVPIFDGEPAREDLEESLYRYLSYDATPLGLFEYVLFVLELWAPRTSGHDADWVASTPIVTAEAFDEHLEGARQVTDLNRPGSFAPTAELAAEGGGRVRFLVHTPMGWERIYYLDIRVAPSRFVEHEAGDVVADLGTGLVF